MKELTAKKILNQVRQTYDQIAADFSVTRRYVWPELNRLISLIQKGQKVLDLGCGNGRLLEILPPQINYLGIDNSAKLVTLAQKEYPGKKFLVFDGQHIPVADNFFDFVYCLAVLHHVPGKKQRQIFLREVWRVLRPGGQLILTVWSAKSHPRARRYLRRQNLKKILGRSELDWGDVLLPWGRQRQPRFIHFFSPRQLTREIKRTGFVVKTSGFLPRAGKEYNIYVVAAKT